MEKHKPMTSIHKLATSFQKICTGLNQQQLNSLNEELLKMYPSDSSEVLFSADYGEEENSIGIGIYVSHPLPPADEKPLSFNQLILEYLIRADLTQLPHVATCIDLMERKEGIAYEVDFVPVFYDEDIHEMDIHFRVTKTAVVVV